MAKDSEEKETHRHETFMTEAEWRQYQQDCKDFADGRKPKGQTLHLLRRFMKKCRDKKPPLPE